MIDVGDVHLADLNEERRRRVLVLSTARFHRAADRVLIAPETLGPPDDVPFPWRVTIDDAVFAVDFLRTIPLDRLLPSPRPNGQGATRRNARRPAGDPQHHLTDQQLATVPNHGRPDPIRRPPTQLFPIEGVESMRILSQAASPPRSKRRDLRDRRGGNIVVFAVELELHPAQGDSDEFE